MPNRILKTLTRPSKTSPLSIKSLDSDKSTKPTTMISTGRDSRKSYFEKRKRTRKRLRKYWNMYSQDGLVFGAITTIATNVVMPGWTIEGENEKAVEYIQNYCRENRLIEDKVFRAVRDCLIFGDGIIENVFNENGELVANFKRDPTTFKIKADEYGIKNGVIQEMNGQQIGDMLNMDQITHIKFFDIPDSPHGMSIIEPAHDTIVRKAKVDESTAEAMVRHGHPKLVIIAKGVLEGEMAEPTDDELNTIKNNLKDLEAKNEIIISDTFEIDTIDVKGVERVEDYFEYFTQILTSSFLVPQEALGLGKNVTQATSSSKIVMFERFIKSLQQKVAAAIESQIFDKICENKFGGAQVRLRFKPITDKDEVLKARWVSSLLMAFKGADKMPMTINEIRKRFDLPELEGGDTLEISHSNVSPKSDDMADRQKVEDFIENG